jgi:hypothetical protein
MSHIKNQYWVRKIAKILKLYIDNLSATIASCCRIVLMSSFSTAIKTKEILEFKQFSRCCILGNGPTLINAIRDSEVILEECDIFCVNMFCMYEGFATIKPAFYFLVDPDYFHPHNEFIENEVTNLIFKLNNEVTWKMYLMVPNTAWKSNFITELRNPNIEIRYLNITAVDGFEGFRHFIYKYRMGMPRCQTVINCALTTAINMQYEVAYLYGADHSWTRDLRVDDNNVVCYGDRHFYEKGLKVHRYAQEFNMYTMLTAFANMFKSHYLIEDYARYKCVKILNCTKGSFVDAYNRFYDFSETKNS